MMESLKKKSKTLRWQEITEMFEIKHKVQDEEEGIQGKENIYKSNSEDLSIK